MNQSIHKQSTQALRAALNHMIDLELAQSGSDNAAGRGISTLARAISKASGQEVSRQRVWTWLHRDKLVPAECCIAIETATQGRVTRYELRPDVYGERGAQ